MHYNKKHVIYLIKSPLTKRNFKRFGIQNWINYDWKVQIFDITKILYPKFWNYIDGSKISIEFDGLIIFQKINNFLFKLNNLENKVVFIDLLGSSNLENSLRKIAKFYGVMVQLKLGSLPSVPKSSFLEKLCLLRRPFILFKSKINFIKNNFYKILAKKYVPDYTVVGGTESMADIDDKETSIIQAHNFDYDFLISDNNIKQDKYTNYLVFLDQNTPYHSDYMQYGIKPYVTAKNYYSVIDSGLSMMAKLLKLNIKIAAHPDSNYRCRDLKYQHHILENKTFELIRDASVVVGHSSTALQWAILMNKPIILVTTNEIHSSFHAKPFLKLINSFAIKLGKKIINLDNFSKIEDLDRYLSVDKDKYRNYIESYIKTRGSSQKLLWDIIIEKLEKELQFKI